MVSMLEICVVEPNGQILTGDAAVEFYEQRKAQVKSHEEVVRILSTGGFSSEKIVRILPKKIADRRFYANETQFLDHEIYPAPDIELDFFTHDAPENHVFSEHGEYAWHQVTSNTGESVLFRTKVTTFDYILSLSRKKQSQALQERIFNEVVKLYPQLISQP